METEQLIQRLGALIGVEHVTSGEARAARALLPDDWEHWPSCVVRPGSASEVAAIVRECEECGAAILPCGSGSRLMTGYGPAEDRPYVVLQSARLNQILDYQPDDLTVTCEPGVTLESLQLTLAERRQFLPLDSPLADRTTLGGLVSSNTAGFSRPAYGTPRDLLIGLRAVMTGGVDIKGGGKVVKNVAGYDVCKLFTGAWGTLGALTELTFKVRPVNESEVVLAWDTPSVSTAAAIGLELYHSQIAPTYVLATNEPQGRATLVVGLQGIKARVEWQAQELDRMGRELGLRYTRTALSDMETSYLRDVQARLHRDIRLAARIACLPTEVAGVVQALELLPDLRITAQCAVGTINVATPSADPAQTLSLRSAAPQISHLLWTRIDPKVARLQNIAVWGEKRQDLLMNQSLKHSLDPLKTFSPGRFVGGL